MPFVPTEKYLEESRDGTVHSSVQKTRCKMCKLDTVNGHPIEMCIFGLMKRIDYLTNRVDKLEKKNA